MKPKKDYSRKPFDVKCPTCECGPGFPCRARTTKRVTDIHAARWYASYGHGP